MERILDNTRIPEHIAIIMDGNGRWATERGKKRSYGHQAGGDAVRRIAALMGLVLDSLEDETFMKNNVRFRVVGDIERLSEKVQAKLRYTENLTKGNSAMTMVVALSYSSRWEITNATRQIAQLVKDGKLSIDEIGEDTLASHMVTNFMPDPELLIRTGGELRISNYLLWQIAYSELYFCDTYWPDFSEEDLHVAIADYQQRQRRFGKTEDQVENED